MEEDYVKILVKRKVIDKRSCPWSRALYVPIRFTWCSLSEELPCLTGQLLSSHFQPFLETVII